MNVNDPAPRPSSGTRWPWLAAVIVAGVGAFMGFQAAYQASLGGLGGALGAAFLAMVIGALVVLAGVVGIANTFRREGRGRVAARYSFAAAGLLLASAAVGYGSVPVLDLGYHEPVILQARGEASLTLEGVPAFEPRDAGRADCQSVADGTDVERVVALSLGELNANVLRADITLPVAGTSGGAISLFVDAAHLPEGSVPPMWTAIEPEVDASSDGASGTVRFDMALIQEDPKLGLPQGSWPEMLVGGIHWRCGRWFAPDASSLPTLEARVNFDLTAHQWVADPDAVGGCEFEPDGSVWVFSSPEVGLLQGRPMTVNLDLGGDPRVGDEVMLMLSVEEAAIPTGASRSARNLLAATSGGQLVFWAGLVKLDAISGGGLTGHLTFEQLPREGTPNLDWPLILSGDLSWECG